MSGEENGVFVSSVSLPDLVEVVRYRARLEILIALARAPKDVSTLAADLDLALSTVSHHLRPLYGWGLVQFDRIDKHHVYRLGRQILRTLCGDTMHLSINMSQGLHLVLQCPANVAVRWDPPSAANRGRNIPNRGAV